MNTLSATLAAAASVALLATTTTTAAANGFTTDAEMVSVVTEVQALHPNPIVLEAITWRPRPSSHPPTRPPAPTYSEPAPARSEPTSVFQLHGGFSEFNERADRAFLAGARLGFLPDPHVQIGVTADWIYRVQSNTVAVPGTPLPGGGTTERVLELSHVSSQRIPIQGYLELTLMPSLGLSPHIGAGAGWHMLFVDAEDNTGAEFDAMYDGWGWQAWGGLTIRFGEQLRMVAEVFRTEANLGRTVEDPDTGTRYHELADGDDIGARFGLRFGS
jgi:hypothetical protein